jgi:hypothetical protein
MSNHATRHTVMAHDYSGQMYHFREDGFFNMTKAAKSFGKRLDHFFENQKTTEYIAALENLVPGIRVIDSRKGNGTSPLVGTWGHPKLATFFARWLDVRFAVFCDMVIDDILNKKAELTITKPEESATAALPQTYLESLEELVKSLEAQEELKKVTQELAPKAEWYDTILSREGLTNIKEADSMLASPAPRS